MWKNWKPVVMFLVRVVAATVVAMGVVGGTLFLLSVVGMNLVLG